MGQAFDAVEAAKAEARQLAHRIAMMLDNLRVRSTNERELQESLSASLAVLASITGARVLREEGLVDELGRGVGRVDFLIGDVALELKASLHWQRSDVLRQVTGYARSSRVAVVIVASTRPTILSGFPPTLVGKPVLAVHLRRFP
jgi:hypothetical protein